MYFKEIETSREKSQAHDDNQKRIAADRARARQAYKKKVK